jgi:hypothetical protein
MGCKPKEGAGKNGGVCDLRALRIRDHFRIVSRRPSPHPGPPEGEGELGSVAGANERLSVVQETNRVQGPASDGKSWRWVSSFVPKQKNSLSLEYRPR